VLSAMKKSWIISVDTSIIIRCSGKWTTKIRIKKRLKIKKRLHGRI